MSPPHAITYGCRSSTRSRGESLSPTQQASDDVFFPLAYSLFLCEDHAHLTGNLSFQDNLLNVPLAREHPWDPTGEPNNAVPPPSQQPRTATGSR